MKSTTIFILFLIILSVAIWSKNNLTIKENQRVLVLRLGKVQGVMWPGKVLITPFVDQPVWVDLDKHIPRWKAKNKQDLEKILIDLVINHPDTDRYSPNKFN